MSGWRNWARTVESDPVETAAPRGVDELAATIVGARARGLRVKAVGAGHSFTAVAQTDGVLVAPEGLSGLIGVDVRRSRARFGAGTLLHDIPTLLHPYRLAMENLGDIDRQTIAGAISTGTHGTGTRFGGIATQLTGLTMVLADGSVLDADERDNPELLPALAVGLGAFGVLAEVELQCVPAFVLDAQEHPEPWDAILEGLPARMAATDHVEFYWWPHTDTVMTKSNTRLPFGTPIAPVGRASAFLEDRVLGTAALGALCAIGHAVPAATPPLNRLATRVYGDREYRDLSHSVFTTRRDVRFRECEYAVPLDALADALRALRTRIEQEGWRISFPIEVRTTAADRNWLSTAYERESGYIAVHRWWRDDHEPYFRAVDEVMAGFDGRPHWGKLHGLGAEQLAERFPRFADVIALRDELDPDRVFGNPYLERVLGP